MFFGNTLSPLEYVGKIFYHYESASVDDGNIIPWYLTHSECFHGKMIAVGCNAIIRHVETKSPKGAIRTDAPYFKYMCTISVDTGMSMGWYLSVLVY